MIVGHMIRRYLHANEVNAPMNSITAPKILITNPIPRLYPHQFETPNLRPWRTVIPANETVYSLLARQPEERECGLALPHRRVWDNRGSAASGFEIEPAFRHVTMNEWRLERVKDEIEG
jgi:hypothetical protein